MWDIWPVDVGETVYGKIMLKWQYAVVNSFFWNGNGECFGIFLYLLLLL